MTSTTEEDAVDDLYSEDFPEFRQAGGRVTLVLPVNATPPSPEPEAQANDNDNSPETDTQPANIDLLPEGDTKPENNHKSSESDAQPTSNGVPSRISSPLVGLAPPAARGKPEEIKEKFMSQIFLLNKKNFTNVIAHRERLFEYTLRECLEGRQRTFPPPMGIKDLCTLTAHPQLLLRYFQYERRVAAALIYLSVQVGMHRGSEDFRNRYAEQQERRMDRVLLNRHHYTYILYFLYGRILDHMFPNGGSSANVQGDERLTLLDPHLVTAIIKKDPPLEKEVSVVQRFEMEHAVHRFGGVTRWTGNAFVDEELSNRLPEIQFEILPHSDVDENENNDADNDIARSDGKLDDIQHLDLDEDAAHSERDWKYK